MTDYQADLRLWSVFFIGIMLLPSVVDSAVKIDAHQRAMETRARRASQQEWRRALPDEHISVNELLNLGQDETMDVTKEYNTVQGTRIKRMQESYKGIPILGAVVAVESEPEGFLSGDATGALIQQIEEDLPDPSPLISESEALDIAIRAEGDTQRRDYFENINIKRTIYLDEANRARSSFKIDYLITNGGIPKRPSFLIDARSGEILKQWNALDTFTCGPRKSYKGQGGNEKIGKHVYGDLPYCLAMKIENGVCILENEFVRVVDLNHSSSSTETASFPCRDGYDDEVNGAYSPVLDAFFYGTIVGKMFKEWYKATPLNPNEHVELRVHYQDNYENAFWDGSVCTFGDGYTDFYPLTGLDTVGHEIAHGVTERNSGLIYSGQSGGMNEAFSDIMGEAAEEYVRGSDFLGGYEIWKGPASMRYFEDPHLDNNSISTIVEYERDDYINVHYSSGIYNRAFYVAVKQKGVSVRNAAHAFLFANWMYWNEDSSFSDGACGVIKAAYDLGVNPIAFVRAFDDVGIQGCDISGHTRKLVYNKTYSGITTGGDTKPGFTFDIPAWAENTFIHAVSDLGAVRIRAGGSDTWDDDCDRDPACVVTEGDNLLEVNAQGTLWIRLSMEEQENVNDVSIRVSYSCQRNYDGDDKFMWRWICKENI